MKTKAVAPFQADNILNPKKNWLVRAWERLEPPNPKELGRSEYNALPSSYFSDDSDAYTWEDWHKEVARDYPIRYFLTHRIRNFWWASGGYVVRRLSDAWYWVKCHTLTSHRFHLLDLRNPAPDIKYTHGFMDVAEVMMWSCFVLLRGYIEKEQPPNPRDHWPAEEVGPEGPLYEQQQHYDEAMALYTWWMKGREEERKATDAFYEAYKSIAKSDKEARNAAAKVWHEAEAAADKREDEMLNRLIVIRRSLWT